MLLKGCDPWISRVSDCSLGPFEGFSTSREAGYSWVYRNGYLRHKYDAWAQTTSCASRRGLFTVKRARLMGKKLQMAYLLLAEGKLTDDEVAARLGVRRRTLEEAKQRPYFERRIEEIRSVISGQVG